MLSRRNPLTGAVLAAALLAVLAIRVLTVAADSLPPSDRERPYPPGPLGDVVRLGEDIVKRTGEHPLSQPYVGNRLTCQSCHLHAGRDPQAATFLRTATAYPAWAPREKRVITLEDRVLNCFMRSMNGVRPPNGSEVSIAVTTYITWLSEGESQAMNPRQPVGPLAFPGLKVPVDQADTTRGKAVYQQHCATCHGDDGQGLDEHPPVWGTGSYNRGAGLAQNAKLASWLKVAMPLGDPNLSEQDALDVAAYLNAQPRPKFVLSEHLPPTERLGEYNSAATE